MTGPVTYPHVAAAEAYVESVLSGARTAGKLEVMACERHRKDMERAASGWEYSFDPIRATRVCRFIEDQHHVKGEWAGRNEKLKLEGWQCFVVVSAFGWIDNKGKRRFRKIYLEVARKNAKSTLLAGVGLYLLGQDGEAGAEVYSAATTKDQARKVFDPARQMVDKSVNLKTKAGLVAQKHKILQPRSNSEMLPLAAQTNSLDGLNPSGSLIDELHAHPNRDVLDVLASGQGARSQPMMFIITTAGSDIAGVCFEERSDLEKILKGVVDDESVFGVIYAIDKEDEAFDPEAWPKANPNYAVSVLPEYLAQEAASAQRTPTKKGEFLRKHCCWWSSAGFSALDLDRFRDGIDKTLTLDDFKDIECIIGLDGSKNDDLTSATVVGYRGDELLVWDEHWTTEDLADEPGMEHVRAWVDEGLINECPGALIDLEMVEMRVREIIELIRPSEVTYDPLYLLQMAQRLSNDYSANPIIVEQRQNTMSLDPALRTAQGLVRNRKVITRGNDAMNWMVANARSKAAGEFLKLFKANRTSKIDGVQAMLTGLARMEAPEEAQPESYLETGAGVIAL